MITNSQDLQPLLDSVQLRQLADCLNSRAPIEPLVEQWSFNSPQELLAVGAKSMNLDWLESDDFQFSSRPCMVFRQADSSPRGFSD